jgi:hypothetical protein
MENAKYSIKEKSIPAWLASKILRTNKTAIVIGDTIHLWNSTRDELLTDKRWLNHELTHIEQFKKYGLIKFLALYSWYTLRYGYYDNPLEVEARANEGYSPNKKTEPFP